MHRRGRTTYRASHWRERVTPDYLFLMCADSPLIARTCVFDSTAQNPRGVAVYEILVCTKNGKLVSVHE